MNIFKKIKKLFSNEVSLDGEPVELITPYQLKNDKFKIGAKLIVPKDMVLVVTLGNKVMEVINEGEYQISSALMPNVANKLRLDKVDKYGKQKDSFSAGAYFVKTNQSFDVNISNYRKLRYTQGYKSYFIVKFHGKVTCKIANLNKIFGILLKNYPRIKSDSAEFLIETILNENLTDKLDRATYAKQDYQDKTTPLLNFVDDKIKDWTSSVGVTTENVEIEFEVKEKLPKEKKEKAKKTKEEKQVEKQLGTEVLEKIEVNNTETEGEVAMYDDEQPKKKSKSKKYVDLSLDNLYDDSESKICQNCGEKNRKDALTCYKCGAKIGEEK